MSWLARKLNVVDIFGDEMEAREERVEWLAKIIWDLSLKRLLPIVVLGKSYKPESSIEAGSSALLLANILREWKIPFVQVDPHVDLSFKLPEYPKLFFIATAHKVFTTLKFPEGSLVVDPFRYMPKQEGVDYYPIGVGR